MDIRKIPKTNDLDKLIFLELNLQDSGFKPKYQTYSLHQRSYHNLYWTIPQDTTKSILITAHWDTVYPQYDNCLDNTASLYNLFRLSQKATNQKYNLVFSYTDAEEACRSEINGATKIADLIDPEYHLDLELTAGGDKILIDVLGDLPFSYETIPFPLNNSKMVWETRKTSILKASGCITLATEKDIAELKSGHYCNRWSQCHRQSDTFDNWLKLDQMELFTDELAKSIAKLIA